MRQHFMNSGDVSKNGKIKTFAIMRQFPSLPLHPHLFGDISLLGLYLVEAMCVEDLTDYLGVRLDDLEGQVVSEGSWMSSDDCHKS